MRKHNSIIKELRRIADTRSNNLLTLQMHALCDYLQAEYNRQQQYTKFLEGLISDLQLATKLHDLCNNKTQSVGTMPTAPQWLVNYFRQQDSKHQTGQTGSEKDHSTIS